MLEQETAGDDVDDRVDRADLVEVDLVDRGPVDLRLRFSQPLEAGDRPGADFAGQGGGSQEADDVGKFPRRGLPPGDDHMHPRSGHSGGRSPRNGDPVA
jgi:hypothetical protein